MCLIMCLIMNAFYKFQLADPNDSHPIKSEVHEVIPRVDVQELKAQLERQELFFR